MPLYIERWLDRAEPDFYMMFVSAWIPFNAWYNSDIAPLTTNGSDAQCISYIATHSNKYKDRIMFYLNDLGHKGVWMRNEIDALQRMLTLHPIPCAATPLNFSTICVDSNVSFVCERDFRHCHYKWKNVQNPTTPHKRFQCSVVDTHTNPHVTKLYLELDKWIEADLLSHPDYIALRSEEMKDKVLEYFREINPKKPLDVIKPMRLDANGNPIQPIHSRKYDESVPALYFDDNNENVAKVLIHLIYKLRCEIFHGSLDPSVDNMEVYEHAYNIQRELIKALR